MIRVPEKPPSKNSDGLLWRRLPARLWTPEQRAWARYVEQEYWDRMTPETRAAKKAMKAAADKKRHAAFLADNRVAYNAQHTKMQRRRRMARTPEQKREDDRNESARQRAAKKLWTEEKKKEVRAKLRAYGVKIRALWRMYPHTRPRSVRNPYQRRKKQYDIHPERRILLRLRTRVSDFVTGRAKSMRTRALIGSDFIERIEERLVGGMTWQNREQWHLDHIVPCSWFDFSRPEHQHACFHNSNVRPLWKLHNTSRRDSVCRRDFDLVMGRCPPEHRAVFEEIIWKIRRREYPDLKLNRVHGHV